MRTHVGAEAFVGSGYAAVRGFTRVGVIADPTSLLPANAEHLVDRMHADRSLVNLSCVFGPEHGFRGDQQAGRGEQAAAARSASVGVVACVTELEP